MRRVLAALLLLSSALLVAQTVAPSLAEAAPDDAATPAAIACTGIATKDAAQPSCGMSLVRGANAITWTRPSTPIASAFEGDRLAYAAGALPDRAAAPVTLVQVWQQGIDGSWSGWALGGAPSARALTSFETGQSYVVVASTDLLWSFAPARAASVLATSRIVSLYGRPGVPQMGALGRYATATAAAQAAADQAAQYAALSKDRPVVPALHVIVDAALADAGYDGTYLGRLPLEVIQPYVEATRAAGELLFLDLQVGWGDPRAEVARLAPLLREPHVHLSIDPEFATAGKNEPPGEAIGYLTAAQLNAVQRDLAAIGLEAGGAPKMLVVHQFRSDMLHDTVSIAKVDGVDLVIDMDGYGSIEQKLEGYDVYARASYATFAAFKLFYFWDTPLLTPEQIMALPHPPDYVIYQ